MAFNTPWDAPNSYWPPPGLDAMLRPTVGAQRLLQTSCFCNIGTKRPRQLLQSQMSASAVQPSQLPASTETVDKELQVACRAVRLAADLCRVCALLRCSDSGRYCRHLPTHLLCWHLYNQHMESNQKGHNRDSGAQRLTYLADERGDCHRH